MRHQNSVFHDVLKQIPWGVFDRLVEEHGSDDLVRKFTTRQQLLSLLFGRFSGAVSLREIEAAMTSHRARLYHVGAKPPRRSTFADANRNRSPTPFCGLLEHMLGASTRGLRRKLGDAVRLIDSTSLRLAGVGSEWSRFSTNVCGAKAHIILDPDFGRPVYHAITKANVNDITAAQEMPIEAGVTYVFDLGYYDYAWWAKLDSEGCRLVTRFKKNTPLREARDLPLPAGTNVLSDRIGFLPARQGKSRKNPMQAAVREIVVKTKTGKLLRILSNDLDAPAQEIADLYKRRWLIELYFRLMKQTLKINRLLGRSENAVRIQVAVALIAFLLLNQLKKITQANQTFLELARLVRFNLMHRKDITRLKQNTRPPPLDSRQLALNLAIT